MAFKKKENKHLFVLFLVAVTIQVGITSAVNLDCKGKAFYCLNSTHFMICVDLGDGISKTVDDFLIPCPPPTRCSETNIFECEFQTTTTTLEPPIKRSEPTKNIIETSYNSVWEETDLRTIVPIWYKSEVEKFEQYYNTISPTIEKSLSSNTNTKLPSFEPTQINDTTTIPTSGTQYYSTNDISANLENEMQGVSLTTNQPNIESDKNSYNVETTSHNINKPETQKQHETTTSYGTEVKSEYIPYTGISEESNYPTSTFYYEQYFDNVSTTTFAEHSSTEIITTPLTNNTSFDPSIEEEFNHTTSIIQDKAVESITDSIYLLTDPKITFISNNITNLNSSLKNEEGVTRTANNTKKDENETNITTKSIISEATEKIEYYIRDPTNLSDSPLKDELEIVSPNQDKLADTGTTGKFLKINSVTTTEFTTNLIMDTITIDKHEEDSTTEKLNRPSITENIMRFEDNLSNYTEYNTLSETTEYSENNIMNEKNNITDLNYENFEIYTQPNIIITESSLLSSSHIGHKTNLFDSSDKITRDSSSSLKNDQPKVHADVVLETSTENQFQNISTTNIDVIHDSEQNSLLNTVDIKIKQEPEKSLVLNDSVTEITAISITQDKEYESIRNDLPEGKKFTVYSNYEKYTQPEKMIKNYDTSSKSTLAKSTTINEGVTDTAEVNEIYTQDNSIATENFYKTSSWSTLESSLMSTLDPNRKLGITESNNEMTSLTNNLQETIRKDNTDIDDSTIINYTTSSDTELGQKSSQSSLTEYSDLTTSYLFTPTQGFKPIGINDENTIKIPLYDDSPKYTTPKYYSINDKTKDLNMKNTEFTISPEENYNKRTHLSFIGDTVQTTNTNEMQNNLETHQSFLTDTEEEFGYSSSLQSSPHSTLTDANTLTTTEYEASLNLKEKLLQNLIPTAQIFTNNDNNNGRVIIYKNHVLINKSLSTNSLLNISESSYSPDMDPTLMPYTETLTQIKGILPTIPNTDNQYSTEINTAKNFDIMSSDMTYTTNSIGEQINEMSVKESPNEINQNATWNLPQNTGNTMYNISTLRNDADTLIDNRLQQKHDGENLSEINLFASQMTAHDNEFPEDTTAVKQIWSSTTEVLNKLLKRNQNEIFTYQSNEYHSTKSLQGEHNIDSEYSVFNKDEITISTEKFSPLITENNEDYEHIETATVPYINQEANKNITISLPELSQVGKRKITIKETMMYGSEVKSTVDTLINNYGTTSNFHPRNDSDKSITIPHKGRTSIETKQFQETQQITSMPDLGTSIEMANNVSEQIQIQKYETQTRPSSQKGVSAGTPEVINSTFREDIFQRTIISPYQRNESLSPTKARDDIPHIKNQTTRKGDEYRKTVASLLHDSTINFDNMTHTTRTEKIHANTTRPTFFVEQSDKIKTILFPMVTEKNHATAGLLPIVSDVHTSGRQNTNVEDHQIRNSTKYEMDHAKDIPSDGKNLQITKVHVFSEPITRVNAQLFGFNCLNRFRGKYSDENNCQKFYICIGRFYPIVGQCPNNTVFSEILKQCTRNLSHCVRNNQFQCASSGRFIDIWTKDVYYICVKSKNKYVRFKLRCQKGYVLNTLSVTCIEDTPLQIPFSAHNSNSKSGSSGSVDSESVNNWKKSTKKNVQCVEEGIFSDPHDCRTYYLCSKNSKSEFRRRKKKCDSDEVFHKSKKKCVDAESYECDS